MNLYEAMQTCRAVRRHRPDPIPDDVLRRVLEAAAFVPIGWPASKGHGPLTRRPVQSMAFGDRFGGEL